MNEDINITTEQREMLLAFLRRHLPDVAVWAYGSRVKCTAHPYSDLDLVAFTSPAQRPAVSELKDELAESDLPFLVDLHIWDEVPERFNHPQRVRGTTRGAVFLSALRQTARHQSQPEGLTLPRRAGPPSPKTHQYLPRVEMKCRLTRRRGERGEKENFCF